MIIIHYNCNCTYSLEDSTHASAMSFSPLIPPLVIALCWLTSFNVSSSNPNQERINQKKESKK